MLRYMKRLVTFAVLYWLPLRFLRRDPFLLLPVTLFRTWDTATVRSRPEGSTSTVYTSSWSTTVGLLSRHVPPPEDPYPRRVDDRPTPLVRPVYWYFGFRPTSDIDPCFTPLRIPEPLLYWDSFRIELNAVLPSGFFVEEQIFVEGSN